MNNSQQYFLETLGGKKLGLLEVYKSRVSGVKVGMKTEKMLF